MGKIKLFLLAAVLAASAVIFTLPADRVAAGANQCTWTGAGADDNWSTTANWTCSVGSVPTNGYDIIFPYLAYNEAVVHDQSATNVYGGIWFTGTIPNDCTFENLYTISGNTIQLATDILLQFENGCNKDVEITADLTFTAAASIDISTTATNEAEIRLTNTAIGANNVAIVSSPESTTANTPNVEINGTLTGSGNVSSTGSLQLGGVNSSYTGNISITGGNLDLFDANASSLGDTGGTTTIGNDASLIVSCSSSTFDIPEDITFTGTTHTYAGGGVTSAKLGIFPVCLGGGAADEYYTSGYTSALTASFSGLLTLNSDLTILATPDMFITGDLDGSGFNVSLVYDAPPTFFYAGALDISATSNNTLTSNGVYSNPLRQYTLSDAQPLNTVYVSRLNEVTVTGSRGDFWVYSGGILKGDGTVGNIDADGATLQPGLSPGIMTTGNLDFDAATTVDIELEGTTPGPTGHDQFDVTGTVSLGDATLNTILFNGYTPTVSDTFVIINNDGADAVTGTFGGLAEGASFNVGAYAFTISYVGGDGNDVVLTTSYEPGPPGTGFGIALQRNNLPFTILAIGSVLLIAEGLRRRYYRVG